MNKITTTPHCFSCVVAEAASSSPGLFVFQHVLSMSYCSLRERMYLGYCSLFCPRQRFSLKLQSHVLPIRIYRTHWPGSRKSEEAASLVFEPSLKNVLRHSRCTWKERSRNLESTCHIRRAGGFKYSDLMKLKDFQKKLRQQTIW